jgi:hypothetical protein
MFAFPLWENTDADQDKKMVLDVYYLYEYRASVAEPDQWTLENRTPVFYMAFAAGVAALLTLYVIFRYDNRILQIKLNALNAFLVMVTIAISAWFIYNAEIEMGENQMGRFLPGFFMPVGALLCISLANRFIKRDEDLVRSVDRIR